MPYTFVLWLLQPRLNVPFIKYKRLNTNFIYFVYYIVVFQLNIIQLAVTRCCLIDIGFIGLCKWPISWEVNQIMSHNCTQIEYMHLLFVFFYLLVAAVCLIFLSALTKKNPITTTQSKVYIYQRFRGHDRIVVGFTTTYAISVYHHLRCEL
jgi:hypothetical protein